jgi:predicted outer membrane protein
MTRRMALVAMLLCAPFAHAQERAVDAAFAAVPLSNGSRRARRQSSHGIRESLHRHSPCTRGLLCGWKWSLMEMNW